MPRARSSVEKRKALLGRGREAVTPRRPHLPAVAAAAATGVFAASSEAGVLLGWMLVVSDSAAPVLALEWLVTLGPRHGVRRALTPAAALVLAPAVFAGSWLFRNARATADPMIDQRLHLGWPILLLGVAALEWGRMRDCPWFTVVGVSPPLLRFSPAPQAYVPIMGLALFFLPNALRAVASRPRLSRARSAGKVVLLLTPLFWFYVALTRYSPGAGGYLFRRISDTEFLSRSGVATPVVRYVNSSPPPDARIWLWCGE